MFKIGEFSKLTQVSVRMLRYHDENGLLRPAHTDPFTGYRLYEAGQIPRLNRILFLRDAGFGVAEMAALLDDWDEGRIAARFAQKQADIRRAITAEEEKLARLTHALAGAGPDAPLHYDVVVKRVPGHAVLSCRRTLPDYYAEGALWKEMAAFAQKNGLADALSGETFTIYHDPDYREQDVDVELCAPTSRMGEGREGFTFRHIPPVERMASTMVYGPFERIAGAFQSFAGWLARHDAYQMGPTSRQIVHRGPWNEEDPAQYLTEIQIPLREGP